MGRDFSLTEGETEALGRAYARRLCDPCLGRLVAKKGHGMTNAERGALVRAALDPPAPPPVPPEDCWLCEGITSEYQKFSDLVVKAFDDRDVETFLIGTRVGEDVKARERALAEEMGPFPSEELKSEVNREVGKLVCEITGKDVSFERPDVVALVDARFDVVELEVHSIFIYGRYRKMRRGIPQTKWPCRACRGKGCRRCGGTGRMYETSVEDLVAGPAIEMFGGEGGSFHGMGREDIDARMLGNGRPFVLEVKAPRIRRLDGGGDGEGLARLEAAINERAEGAVEVEGLRPSDRDEVASIKDRRCFKTYEVEVEAGRELDRDGLAAIVSSLEGTTISQRTPTRVSHRRGDLVRRRIVRSAKALSVDGKKAVISITGEAGIYIKELITGDEGRTEPSLARLLGDRCEVLALDVVHIHDDETEGS